jgi:HlyD family secretion protein
MEEIELRSEEVQEVLGAVPHWILRWGIIVISAIVFVLFTGSWFFKYPDTISATMTLTSATPSASLVAKTNGRLKELYVSDKRQVKDGEYLAVIENPASTDAMLKLKSALQQLLQQPDSIASFGMDGELQLGNVQGLYASFVRSLRDYRKFVELDYYPQKMLSLQERINSYQHHYSGLKRQHQITGKQHQIVVAGYERDSLLMQRGFISQQELESAQTQYLQSRIALENSYAALENHQIRMLEFREMLLDYQQQYSDQKSKLKSELNTNIVLLINEINTWEMIYVLVAPFAGQITFTNYWAENQNVTAGESIFSIIPEKEESVIGKALLPVARSGKVKKGQKANIYLLNYPDEEFGIVRGIVENISLIPVDNHYTVEIALPDGLRTTYKKTLPFSQEMTANAEIITEDLRLLERIFLPVKKLFMNKS